MDQQRAFGEHDSASEEDGPFIGKSKDAQDAAYPSLDLPAELKKVALATASNGPNLTVECELPVFSITGIVQLAQGITLAWADQQGNNERLIGVGASLARATISPDPDGGLHLKVVWRLSQTEIPSALGVVGAGVHADATKGRIRIRSDQGLLDLSERA